MWFVKYFLVFSGGAVFGFVACALLIFASDAERRKRHEEHPPGPPPDLSGH